THGFTLIEVMVALTISGLVLLAASQIFAGVGDGGRALVAAREILDRDANASRYLKAAFLSLEVGLVAHTGFEGRSDAVQFTAWQQTAGGWFEPQRIELQRQDSAFVAVHGTEAIVLAGGVQDVAFDYLLEPGADSRWVREWISPVSAPLAVRIRIERGTVD